MRLLDLHPRLGELLARVEATIVRACGDEPGFLTEAAGEALLGRAKGKRLRPTLLLLSAECAGGAGEDSIAMASVVEIVHAASLVHDDVIDDASARRGRLSAKAVWGNKVSVLLGDYLIARALSLLPSDDRDLSVSDISNVAARMCEGQIRELRSAGRPIGEDEYFQTLLAKTGSLFAFCCRAGVRTAGSHPAMDAALSSFGEKLGVAFQLADDILDLVGTNGRSGKSQGRDLSERKWTLPLIHMHEQAEPAVHSRLTAILEAERISSHDLEIVSDLAQETGAIDYAWGRVGEWLAGAREQLAVVPDSRAREALLAMTRDHFPMPVMSTSP